MKTKNNTTKTNQTPAQSNAEKLSKILKKRIERAGDKFCLVTPYTGGIPYPVNIESKRPYSGINSLLEPGVYGGYRQLQKKGFSMEGTKGLGQGVLVYKTYTKKSENDEDEEFISRFASIKTVFNVADLPEPKAAEYLESITKAQDDTGAAAFMKALKEYAAKNGIEIVETEGMPYFTATALYLGNESLYPNFREYASAIIESLATVLDDTVYKDIFTETLAGLICNKFLLKADSIKPGKSGAQIIDGLDKPEYIAGLSKTIKKATKIAAAFTGKFAPRFVF